MRILFVLALFLTSSLCALLSTDMIASVHLIENDKLVPMSQIYEDLQTLKHKETALISLQFAGHSYVLELTLGNDVVSPDFVHQVVSEDNIHEDVEHNMFEHCAYNAKVRGMENSEAHLLTCGGSLHGTMRIKDKVYNIVQKEGQIVVTSHDDEEEEIRMIEPPLSPTELSHTAPRTSHKRQTAPNNVITVLYVVSPSCKANWAKLGWTVEQAVRTEVFLVDGWYQKLGLRVQCVGILQPAQQLIEEKNGNDIIRFFSKWQKDKTPQHDWGFYRTGSDSLTALGYIGQICTKDTIYNCGIGHLRSPHPYSWAKTWAHEMGHGVGMLHDQEEKPKRDCCPGGGCIMSGWTTPEKLEWTKCVIDDFKAWAAKAAKCFEATPCKFGQWGPWDMGQCTGGYMFRNMSASNGCLGPREIKPAPVCTAPTAPRIGVMFANPTAIQMWACDPNNNAWLKVQIRVSGTTTVLASSTFPQTWTRLQLYETKCLRRQYTYDIKFPPGLTVGTKLTISAIGVNNAGVLDGVDASFETVVTQQTATAVSEEDQPKEEIMGKDYIFVPEDQPSKSDEGLSPLAVGLIVGCSVLLVVVVAVVALYLYRNKKGDETAYTRH